MMVPNSISFLEIEEVYKACGIDPKDIKEVAPNRTLSDYPLHHTMPSMFKTYEMTFSTDSDNSLQGKP